jgi:hypothetical protein
MRTRIKLWLAIGGILAGLTILCPVVAIGLCPSLLQNAAIAFSSSRQLTPAPTAKAVSSDTPDFAPTVKAPLKAKVVYSDTLDLSNYSTDDISHAADWDAMAWISQHPDYKAPRYGGGTLDGMDLGKIYSLRHNLTSLKSDIYSLEFQQTFHAAVNLKTPRD